MSKLRIYLVEDDPLVVQFCTDALKDQPDMELIGHSDSCTHAIQHAAAAQADVYLVDMGLPDGYGTQVLQEIKIDCRNAKRLVFTVFGDDVRLLTALTAGAQGYVLKGCSAQELVASIRSLQDGSAPVSPRLARTILKLNETRPELGLDADTVQVLKSIMHGFSLDEVASNRGESVSDIDGRLVSLYQQLSSFSRYSSRMDTFRIFFDL